MHVLIDRKDSISSLLSMSMLLAYQRPMPASTNGLRQRALSPALPRSSIPHLQIFLTTFQKHLSLVKTFGTIGTFETIGTSFDNPRRYS
jgi:hypothetical protein